MVKLRSADYASTVWSVWESGPVAAAIFAALALAVLAGKAEPVTEDSCLFEQTWYSGDQHYWDIVELRPDQTGRWTEGGMGGDGPYERVDFRWRRTDTTFTAIYGSADHATAYKLEPRDERCRLSLAVHPFRPDHGSLLLTNVSPFKTP